MAVRPTVDDLISWLKLQSTPSDDTMIVYNECMNAALGYIESRVNLPVTYPPEVRTAILMTGARLAKRSTSPEGVAGMSDLGIAVRILPADPDVERLILRYLKLDGFA